MNIEVLGPGCAKCNALETAVRQSADQLGLDYTLEHVRDIAKIAAAGVMLTPALVSDGRVVMSGSVPGPDELRRLLTANSHQ